MSIALDTRQIRIVRWLLDQSGPRRTADLASDLGLSQRVVRYRLSGVSDYLERNGLELITKPGIGMWIEGPGEASDMVRTELASRTDARRLYAQDERMDVLRAALLFDAPDVMSLDKLQWMLEVSKTSTRRDVNRCEPWLESFGLHIARRPGAGIALLGPEIGVRQALVKLILESVPTDAMLQLMTGEVGADQLMSVKVVAGMREFIDQLPLRECWHLVQGTAPVREFVSEGELVLPIYLAVAAARLRQNKGVELDAGHLRSLLDHPIASTATRIGEQLGQVIEKDLRQPEIAVIAEYLLGITVLNEDQVAIDGGMEALIDEMLDTAANRIHPVLRDDAELRRSLGKHLERLETRLNYGLPVHNPLLTDIVQRYPDVHEVALDISQGLSLRLKQPISADEVGFITMYLSGALERTRLRPRKRAMVVCPSGMATAWILVARIQSEFPQLDLVSVVSASDFAEKSRGDIDMVISTVQVSSDTAAVVVVNALLTGDDIRAISLLL